MPMKRNVTPSSANNRPDGKSSSGKEALNPNPKTILFLKLFARNYHAEKEMPRELQGIFLG